MTIGIDAYPLQWPVGWKRTPVHQRHRSGYKVPFLRARDALAKELSMLSRRSSDVVISTNVPTRRDGLPYANQREPDDPGVAAYWVDRTGRQRVIACDAWRTVRENMRAVGIAVAAFRAIERSKASEILERVFQGFALLPETTSEEHWSTVLGVRPNATKRDVQEAYQAKAFELHPDRRGGSAPEMVRLNNAYERAKKELG